MKRWHRPSKPAVEPEYGTVLNLKEYLSLQAGHRCVYCGIHSNRCGGLRNLHVEHYRPKKKFPALEYNLANLYIACAFCNTYKSDDWPREPDGLVAAAYPEPSGCDYNDIFLVHDDGRVDSSFVAGRYMMVRIGLNRAQLRLDRREERLSRRLSGLVDSVERLLASPQIASTPVAVVLLREAVGLLVALDRWKVKGDEIVSYTESDTKRA